MVEIPKGFKICDRYHNQQHVSIHLNEYARSSVFVRLQKLFRITFSIIKIKFNFQHTGGRLHTIN